MKIVRHPNIVRLHEVFFFFPEKYLILQNFCSEYYKIAMVYLLVGITTEMAVLFFFCLCAFSFLNSRFWLAGQGYI